MDSPMDKVDRQARLAELRMQHAQLETRLKELERHLSLSPDEQRERTNLKKAKLQLKDSMLSLQR
jgi:uncharacterized protein YdcH (DUF465 family)